MPVRRGSTSNLQQGTIGEVSMHRERLPSGSDEVSGLVRCFQHNSVSIAPI
jgi:hypothetical protein